MPPFAIISVYSFESSIRSTSSGIFCNCVLETNPICLRLRSFQFLGRLAFEVSVCLNRARVIGVKEAKNVYTVHIYINTAMHVEVVGCLRNG